MPEFQAGQRWTYRTRPGEEASRALILRIDEHAGERIFSVRLDDLHITNPASPDGVTRAIGHLPISEEKWQSSALELVETLSQVPEEPGYAQWKAAFDRGEAGVFTLTLAEIVEGMQQALAQSQAAPTNEFKGGSFDR